MNLNRRLDAWRRAEIIDDDIADRIRAFEETAKRPTGLYALVGLGALAIGIGIIAIIAANWDAIPPAAKLAVDLLIGAGLAYGIERLIRTGPRWGAEALLIVFYLFVLASIGLLGQIYQLGSPLHVALGVWTLATLPLLTLARSRFAGVLWATGLVTAYAMNAVEWVDGVNDANQPNIAAVLIVALPLLLLALGWLLRPVSDKLSGTFEGIAWVGIAGGAFIASFIWYGDVGSDDVVTWGAGVAILLVALPIAFGKALFGERAVLASSSLVIAAVSLLLPIVFSHADLDLLGGLAGLAVLGFAAFALYSIGHRVGFSIATAAIGVRIITIYFEVFGSLMSTGVGLITGGALTLLVAWLWARTSKTLSADFAEEARHAQ